MRLCSFIAALVFRSHQWLSSPHEWSKSVSMRKVLLEAGELSQECDSVVGRAGAEHVELRGVVKDLEQIRRRSEDLKVNSLF